MIVNGEFPGGRIPPETELAEALGVSRTTVFRLVRAKRLEAVELLPGSRFLRRADVEALANR